MMQYHKAVGMMRGAKLCRVASSQHQRESAVWLAYNTQGVCRVASLQHKGGLCRVESLTHWETAVLRAYITPEESAVWRAYNTRGLCLVVSLQHTGVCRETRLRKEMTSESEVVRASTNHHIGTCATAHERSEWLCLSTLFPSF